MSFPFTLSKDGLGSEADSSDLRLFARGLLKGAW
jgi:hypothetical protein